MWRVDSITQVTLKMNYSPALVTVMLFVFGKWSDLKFALFYDVRIYLTIYEIFP
jgi:hypothetical protein